MQWTIVGKYFLHGILFSVLFLLLGFAWVFITILLVSLGAIIGLIIGIGLLFLIAGFINTVLGVHLWNIEAETGFWSIFGHGLVLFILLSIANLITSFLPNLAFPGTATFVVTFIITTSLNGVIGKNVASWFGHEIRKSGIGMKVSEFKLGMFALSLSLGFAFGVLFMLRHSIYAPRVELSDTLQGHSCHTQLCG